ncbi:hypothetical protein PV379_05810 [Streptomyces caniscabiei]|uniref:hypothetical protein n=1 Tax=Streptomyces caniscabiei TaxID=2746961 RepID=UPI0029A9317F|nr:hypothetical protein [Streptomyces caniscabiei]MDX2606202.1 hypothetical protein [Streptomyces caniscabiei]MDX2741498.1 hypothetical protein [Streptomyces caniscabiei]MDX2776844.1 hypothetical protein [Streptomyces caniscabiei]
MDDGVTHPVRTTARGERTSQWASLRTRGRKTSWWSPRRTRRYLGALSTYTRRRLAQAARAAVDSVERVPAARSRCQRPGLLGVRSTFGASTELLN